MADINAAREQYRRLERIERETFERYRVVCGEWEAAHNAAHSAYLDWLRLDVRSRPARPYIVGELAAVIYRRPPTAAKIDPYHDPGEVERVLTDLVAEGLVERQGRGYVAVDRQALEAEAVSARG